jgi:hypothetical protein
MQEGLIEISIFYRSGFFNVGIFGREENYPPKFEKNFKKVSHKDS